jgi:hypothetical protein
LIDKVLGRLVGLDSRRPGDHEQEQRGSDADPRSPQDTACNGNDPVRSHASSLPV